MRYDFYKHSRTGVIISVSSGLRIGGLWVKIAEGVRSNWKPEREVEEEVLPGTFTIEDVTPEVTEAREEVAESVEGLDWLFDGEPNNFQSYKELVREASREFPARVGETVYEFNGRSWVKEQR